VPSLPAEVHRVFADIDAAVVFDVGGDDDGAIALGRYKRFFAEEEPEVLFVINRFRPLSSTCDQVVTLMKDIEAVSRLAVTGLVNSSNLAGLTTAGDVLSGQKLVDEVEKETGILCRYIAAMPSVLNELPGSLSVKFFPIERFLALPF